MTIAKTMTAIDLKLTPPTILTSERRRAWNAYYEPRNAAFRAARASGKELVSWKYQRYVHDYLGVSRPSMRVSAGYSNSSSKKA